METFQLLSTICKFADAFARNNNTRKSVDFPILSPFYTTNVPLKAQDAIITIPFNSRCIGVCPSWRISKAELEKAQDMVGWQLGPTEVHVNKLLYDTASSIFDHVVSEIDTLFDRDSPILSNTTSMNIDDPEIVHNAEPQQHESSVFARCSVPVSPHASQRFTPKGRQSLDAYSVHKSNTSVVSLARIFIGGKMLRMQRFVSSFFVHDSPGGDSPVPCVILTGFAASGAICKILSCMIMQHYGPRVRIKCVTFGSPAAGDAAFASEYVKTTHRNYNIVLQDDAMVSVLPEGKGYSHTKSCVKLGRQGNYVFGDMLATLMCCKSLCGRDGRTTIDDYDEAIIHSMHIDASNKTIVGSIANMSSSSLTEEGHTGF